MKKSLLRTAASAGVMALALTLTPAAVADEAPVELSTEGDSTECRNPSVSWEIDLSGGGAGVSANVDPGRICFAAN